MSDPTPTELSQAALIEQLQMERTQLQTRLDSYEASDTIPPTSRQDEPTGNYSLERAVALLEQRMDQYDARESDRAGELQDVKAELRELGGKITELKDLVEKYPAVDPQDIRDIKRMLLTIPCLKGCDPDPEKLPSLHSVRCAGE